METPICRVLPGRVLLVSAMLFSPDAFPAGLGVLEQSASAAARGVAGAAAVADDASTVFYNPAGMTRLRRNEIMIATGIGLPSTRFENAGGFDPAGGSLTGSAGIPGPVFFAPSAFGVWAVSEDVRIGVGLTSPFGQDAKFNDGWIGRYSVTNASFRTADLSANVAWRVNPVLSVGGGIDYQHATVNRRNAIDFGSACFGAIGPAACAGLGVFPQTQDGSVKLDARSNGFGFNLGVMLEPREGLRLGASYRSRITHNFSGTAAFTVPAATAFLTGTGQFRSTGASADVTLPESVSLGVAADLSPAFTLLGGLVWTRTSRFDNLVIRYDNPAQPTTIEPQHWKDTWRASVGFDYRFSPALTAHGGFAFDQSPVPAQFRYPFQPDADRLIFNTGFTWRPGETFSMTLSYTYNYAKDAPVALASPTAGTLTGNFKRDYNVVGLQAGWRF